jgi:hypothetical protein
MPFSFRTLSFLTLSTLAGGLVLLRGAMNTSPLSAEEFQPIKEAEMPRGFPKYTPVGKIEVKEYPAYRKATASGTGEFWKLFAHIQQNKVAMTAPVEMDYGDAKAQKAGERSMSFLYGSPDLGKAGSQGDVTVSDVAAMKVVSIGCRGNRTAAAVSEAQRKVLDYLSEHKDKYAIAGPLRVMGYNSPFVPRDKNFFEVQIPVKSSGH